MTDIEKRTADTEMVEALFTELFEQVKSYNNNPEDLKILEKAFAVAKRAHGYQTRASGEPYITHPLKVALILAGIKMDIPTVTAAILHDVIEDTEVGEDSVTDMFGKEITGLVDGVTKLTAISASTEQGDKKQKSRSRLDKQAENLRKIFLAMAKDIRVILIKVADRLHNISTLDALPEHKQKYIARETIEIFAPIAGRLGLWSFKWKLEDMAFKYLYPSQFEELEAQIAKRRKESEKLIEEVQRIIRENVDSVGLKNVHIEGRPKHLYSIYQKMTRKHYTLDDIYDFTAVRIIVNTIRECYQVLGIIHNLWMPFMDRFKDYIAMPKANNYRSLHTTVYGPGNEPLEVQIRTWEMHRVNEFGIAAHWAYKEGGSKDINMTNEVYPWIRRILDFQDDSIDAREYIENLKLDLLDNDVFVFTPNGDVIDLPAGSTPIDFAYTIHTEVGHRCIGAKVNSKIVPIEYKLNNADIIEILTSKHGNPSLDWLKICKTNMAKNKIRQWFKRERRESNIERGRTILDRELKRHKIEISLGNVEVFSKIAKKYNIHTVDDLFASIGYGETSAMTVMHRVKELVTPKKPEIQERTPEEIKRRRKKARKAKSPVIVEGLDNMMVRFARCCTPVRGDDILGYVTMGKGVSVHRKDCSSFGRMKKVNERLVKVHWSDEGEETLFTIQLEVEAIDRPGLLADVMNKINESRVHTNSCLAWAKGALAIIRVSVDVKTTKDIQELIKELQRLKSVSKVFRATKKI